MDILITTRNSGLQKLITSRGCINLIAGRAVFSGLSSEEEVAAFAEELSPVGSVKVLDTEGAAESTIAEPAEADASNGVGLAGSQLTLMSLMNVNKPIGSVK